MPTPKPITAKQVDNMFAIAYRMALRLPYGERAKMINQIGDAQYRWECKKADFAKKMMRRKGTNHA